MKLEKFYCNLEKLHINTEPNRSYYIPCQDEGVSKRLDSRFFSEQIQMLNGIWGFSYYESQYDIPENCVEIDSDYLPHTQIPVPSVWQNHGFGKHQYINERYPIPFEPPYVPKLNPCGVYTRKFDIRDFEQLYINFEGVDSCFYLWINGKFVGYSQVSHSTSEFNISKYVRPGENNITVIVLKWCDGTYLEDQDKFRTSGIFRDVYLIYRPTEHIRDYKVISELNEDYSRADIICDVEFVGKDLPVEYSLLSNDGNILRSGTVTNGRINISIENPNLWNAENPYLYTLVLCCSGEYISQPVGICEIKNDSGVLKINGVRTVFKGVNRHDTHPEKGPAVGYDDVLKDILLMKRNNINGLRTSHYPNAPYLPLLCNYYGLYMIAEADMESHGIFSLYGEEKGPQYIQNNQLFMNAIVDRQKLLYERDKNNVAIIMWSTGNESGWGINMEAALSYLKSVDKKRLTHYEDLRPVEDTTMDLSDLDTYSRMYPSIADIEKYCKNQYEKNCEERKPIVLCEYAHSMGNGPGDFELYYQLLDKYPEFCGGFVWEWCDHAVNMGTTQDGKIKYGYGGDFGDTQNDGNFCMDGMVRPDRTPYPSLYEFRNVMRPIRFTVDADGQVYAINQYDYIDASKVVDMEYEISLNGYVIKEGKCNMPELPPRKIVKLPIRIENRMEGHRFVRFILTAKQKEDYWDVGDEIGFEQIELTKYERKYNDFEFVGKIKAEINEKHIIVTGKKFKYVFNKLISNFESINFDGTEYLKRPIEYTVWRAPTDNDMCIRTAWEKAGYDRLMFRPYECECINLDGAVIIRETISVCASSYQRLLLLKTEWYINGEGKFMADISATKNESMPSLPRFGIRIFLPSQMDKVEYSGFGPMESYSDKHYASYFGAFASTVDEMFEDYYKPQENGSHFNSEKLKIFSDQNVFEVNAADTPFSFNVSNYTAEQLTEAKHNYELKKSEYTVLVVDYKQNGIGSASCGPALAKEYNFNDKKFRFNLIINPTTNNLK